MHVRDSFLKLYVLERIEDPYTKQLVEEHIEVCPLCLGKSAEYADEDAEGKLQIGELDAHPTLTDKEIADLLQWRDLHKETVKENKKLNEEIKKSFKWK